MRIAGVGLVTLLLIVGCGSAASPDAANGTPPAEPTEPTEVLETATSTVESAASAPPVVSDEAADESSASEAAETGDGLYPTVVDAMATPTGGSEWRFDVTLLSEYDSPERYADAWRVLDSDDNELGIRVLGHDHANEQPFTRSTTVDVPANITVVFVEGRDQVNGWSGERFELALTLS